MKLRLARPVSLAVSLFLGPAFAHHAPAIYDTSRQTIVSGTVVAFEWTEPHTLTRLRVTDGDQSGIVWPLEGMSPSYLGRRGWNRRSLEPGDRVAVVLFPRKDGEPGGMLIRVTLPDGSLKVMADVPADR